jgi:hypothetical protein
MSSFLKQKLDNVSEREMSLIVQDTLLVTP